MKVNLKKSFLFLFLFMFVSFGLNLNRAYAQEISIGYAPTADYLNLQPGETYSDHFTVWNLKDTTNTYYIYISGFEQIQDFPGTSIPLSPEDDAKDPYSASSWVVMEIDEIDLVPQKDIDINYSITVPSNAAFGEYTLKIFLSTNKQLEEDFATAAIANLAAGPSILIQVGDKDKLTEEVDLLKFTTEKFFYEKPPVKFITEIENTGNTHITPQGDIVVTNFLGKEILRLPLNPSDISTLRGQIAKYLANWETNRQVLTEENQIMFGPMKAQLIATYKSENPGFYPILSETTFWVIPWKILLAIIVGIIVLYFISRNRKKKSSKKDTKSEK